MILRLVKDQIGSVKSQETLDSIELQSSFDGEVEEQETRQEGNSSPEPNLLFLLMFPTFSLIFSYQSSLFFPFQDL